jgi:hypothetical protein
VISVIIPTVPGREEIFSKVRDAYEGYSPPDTEIIVEYDHPTVGCAWQAGAEKAVGDYIHMGNDDCEPHSGWWKDAVEAVDHGYVPSPFVRGADGAFQSLPTWGQVAPDWTTVACATVPFLARRQWEAIKPLLLSHYYSDNFITDRAAAEGWTCVLRHGYAFTHHWAAVRRGAGFATQGERDAYDRKLYQQALGMVAAGQWTEPWPAGGRL